MLILIHGHNYKQNPNPSIQGKLFCIILILICRRKNKYFGHRYLVITGKKKHVYKTPRQHFPAAREQKSILLFPSLFLYK